MEGSSRKMKWKCWFKVELLLFIGILCTVMLYIVYETTDYQYQHTKTETVLHPFESMEKPNIVSNKVGLLPHGIVQARSDMETKPLWLTRNSREKNETIANQNLLAIPSGLRQKENVNTIAEKFLAENFTIILFHYDGNVDGWYDLHWSKQVIHISACNQTKWWFAKRFLHPDVVSIYDYIFIWDEDLGVKNFHPGRYLKIVKSERLEISQPALDPSQSEIHHMITIRRKTSKVHRKIRGTRGNFKCSHSTLEPPCAGWVEGMAPVFSRSAWRCAWYLIQNDLVHGWGMDLKLGYCAQGDPTKTVGVVDSEFIVHKGIQTLGGSSLKKGHVPVGADMRSEVRRQSKLELETFRKRWEKATREDKNWVDPFKKLRNRKKGIPR